MSEAIPGIKILWQAHEGNISGANICLLEFIDVLKINNFIQKVILPANGSMVNEIEKRGIPLFIIPSYSWAKSISKKQFFLFKLRRFLRNKVAVNSTSKLIKNFDPDFISTNSIANPTAAYAAKNTRKKHIWFVHEFGEEDHGFIIADNTITGIRIMNRLSYKLVFNSKAVEKKYIPYINDDKRFIVNNVGNIQYTDVINRNGENKIKLIMLGQIAPSKNHMDALKALKICVEKDLDIELNIVGSVVDEDYFKRLSFYISDKRLINHVNFIGATASPESVLVQNDILLMCSRMEAFGRVTVEALKCGLPVIAAKSGGSIEIIEDGINGYLYEPGNVSDLADKIFQLQNNYSTFSKTTIANSAMQKYNEHNTLVQLKRVFN